MKYDQGTGELKNWIVAEESFDPKFQGKCEATFSQGNGYLGVRSATEESYVGQVRNFFVAGTFNKSDENEVTELPNAADVLGMEIYIDLERFSLETGQCEQYNRSLNLKNGELTRSFTWTNTKGKVIKFTFKRFVSFDNLHILASRVIVEPVSEGISLMIKSGINGQVTNSGAQHFMEGEKRVFDQETMQYLQKTNETGIDFIHNTHHIIDGEHTQRFELDRRKIHIILNSELEAGQSIDLFKLSNVYTSRDKDHQDKDLQQLRDFSLTDLKEQLAKGYDQLLHVSANVWAKHWERMGIRISGKNEFDQLAIRFALYHLMIMTPAHDNRFGIAAKGLSGEGYKGHSFWDSEIFILPFFTYIFPEISRSLLEYRYQTIGGARKKAEENGYQGAMYPWESAWADDGEVTPVWGGVDIVTGKATKIWSGFIEQHITSDVAFAIWQYYRVTGDEDFMVKYGYEILMDTGIFWGSRLEWNEEKEEYHINNVVGPDEYKEHVNNDAFTNHMAKWCMENAIHYYYLLKDNEQHSALFNNLNEKLKLDERIAELEDRIEKFYIPETNQDLIIPQDDTYLSLKEIDLTKYKNQKHVGLIFQDYNLDQVNQMQVSKQASVVMLMYLLEHKFSQDIKVANYKFYEPKTLHDSSLSMSIHSVLASDVRDPELAYSLYEKASRIDLGPNMKTSDHGIHAAAIGGIWQMMVCGFGGIRMVDGELRINPGLPEELDSIEFPLIWKGNTLKISIDRNQISIVNESNEPVGVNVFNEKYEVTDQIRIEYSSVSA